MPRSCRSGDMAGTFMLYPPGTDGAAVTDVRLRGSRPSASRIAKHQNALDPGLHDVLAHLDRTRTDRNPGLAGLGRHETRVPRGSSGAADQAAPFRLTG